MVKLKRIYEAKQVGTIYHVCGYKAALYNLEHNSITPSTFSNVVKGKRTISFTRDKNYIVDTISANDKIFFQFALNGDKLSENKKIIPYADPLYQDYSELEKEEVVLGEVDNLKSYLQEVTVFVSVSSIEHSFFVKNYTIEEGVISSLELLSNYGVKTSVRVVLGKKNLSPVKTLLPKEVKSLLELFKRVNHYSSSEMFLAIESLCKQFFSSIASIELNSSTVSTLFKETQKVTSLKEEILSLVETIKEELDCESLVVTQSKQGSLVLKRHSDIKLSTVLNNRTYRISSLSIEPYFDYLYNQIPKVTLRLLNAKSKLLTFYVYYQ